MNYEPDHEHEKCDHGVWFDEEKAQTMSVKDIRLVYPRLFGECPYKCGFKGISYASKAHYVLGDW